VDGNFHNARKCDTNHISKTRQKAGGKSLWSRRRRLQNSAEEFDRRFDDGEDMHDLIDISKAKIVRHGEKISITLDMAEELVKEIDGIRDTIGVNRGALIKILLYERVKQEKVLTAKH